MLTSFTKKPLNRMARMPTQFSGFIVLGAPKPLQGKASNSA